MEYRIGSMVLDGWKIVRRIGSGASGAVYEVQKQKDDITLSSALKVMKVPQDPSLPDTLRGDGMDEGSVTRYLQGVVDELIREIKIMVELKGFPYTVNCEDYEVLQDPEEEQWDVLIRMELLTPLQKYQQGRSLTEKDVYRMAVQLAEALCLFEDEKIIHRDIKPENIFLNKYGTCKIGDFGIARAYDRATGELSKKGTENYMAPEVYWGEDYGHTVDIYSLGLVLYKLMNKNRLPFYPLDREYTPSDRQRALAERMRGTRELEPPACASAQFGQIILKMCAYRPEDRYPDAKTLQQALEEYTPSNQVVLDDGRSIDGARTLAGGKTGVASTGQTQEDLDETNVMFGSSRSLRGLAKTDDGKIIAKSDGASVGDGNDASGKTSDSAEQTDEKSGPERTVGPEGIASDSTGLTNETQRSRLGHVEDIGGAEVTADSRTQTPEYEPPRAAAAVRRDTGYDAAKTRQRLEELEIENRKQREKRRKICRFALEGAAVLVILVAIISPLWKSRKFILTVDGGSGSGSYKAGETVTVQAEVPEGSRFTGWVSDGVTLTAEEETDENLEITMPSKKVTLTAGVEEIAKYEVTVLNQNGDGETISAGTYQPGETVTLQAAETTEDDTNGTSIFTGWVDVDGTLGDMDFSTNELTFTMPENDVEVQALYEQQKYILTVIGGSGSGSYKAGETVNIQAKRPKGNKFTGWTSDGLTLTAEEETDENLEIIMPPEKVTLTAGVEKIAKYEVTVINQNGNGETASAGTYESGETVRLQAAKTIVDDDGMTRIFAGWEDELGNLDNVDLSSDELIFEMPAEDVEIQALYEQKKYTLTVSGGSGSGEYEPGETVAIQADAGEEGQTFLRWSVETGILSGVDLNEEQLSFEMPQEDVAVTAQYEAKKYTLTVSGGNGSGEYAAGDVVTIQADAGREFLKWNIQAGGLTGVDLSASQLTFTMPSSDLVLWGSYGFDSQIGIESEIGSYPIKGGEISGINYLKYKSQTMDEIYTGDVQLEKIGKISTSSGENCNYFTAGFVKNSSLIFVHPENKTAGYGIKEPAGLMDLAGNQLTDFSYSVFRGYFGWIIGQKEDTEKWGVLSQCGDEVVPVEYDDIGVLNSHWTVAWDSNYSNTVFYYMGEKEFTYIKMKGCVIDDEDCQAEEKYLNIKLNDNEIITFDENFNIVANPESLEDFTGLTEHAALESKLKTIYGDQISLSNKSEYWAGDLLTEYLVIESEDSEGEKIQAVTDKNGNLIIPFSRLLVEDYEHGYFLLHKDEKYQFWNVDGTMTAEIETYNTVINWGMGISYYDGNSANILLAADGTETKYSTSTNTNTILRLGRSAKLWQQSIGDNLYNIVDWHGNTVIERVRPTVGDQISADGRFLLISEEDGLIIYSLDGASVDDVVATVPD